MKKISYLLVFVVISFITVFTTSCEKEYTGSVVFWLDKESSDELISDGITEITIYLDNAEIGTYKSDFYFNTAPTCDQSGVLSVVKDLGDDSERDFTYKVLDNNNNEILNGTIEIDANECETKELDYN